ncbi:MAG: hypothetical protein KJO07_25305 [Deltaproteobacteria bacterium]|nr:hypothetical protein [Deltaproteobacteria bacterium]
MRLAAAAALVAGLACGVEPLPDPVIEPCERDGQLQPLESLSFVAHAAGSPQGLEPFEIYTNSREAFEISYTNGFRVFELDLLRLADGTVVAAHDGYEATYGLDIAFGDATRADVDGLAYDGRYQLLLAADVVDLMREYPDVWVILDSKWEHTEIARTFVELTDDTSILDRMVPHLASSEHVAELEALYPFPERMLAVYRWPLGDVALVETMLLYGIDNVMMWWDRRWTPRVQELLDDAELNSWVHTPAQREVIDDFLERGVRLYSDGYIDCTR